MYYGNQYPPQTPYASYPSNGAQSYQQFNMPTIPTPQAAYPQYTQQPVTQLKPTINGRVIHAIEEVTPNEVPMDGSFSLFVKDDYSCVYAKAWNTDGTIRTLKFIPETVTDIQTVDANSMIMTKLDSIEELLNRRFNNKPQQKVGEKNA